MGRWSGDGAQVPSVGGESLVLIFGELNSRAHGPPDEERGQNPLGGGNAATDQPSDLIHVAK